MAQNTQTTAYTMQWEGVQTWSADSITQRVITLKDAIYPTSELIPYINVNIPIGEYIPDIEIVEPKFAAVSGEELSLLGNAEIPETLLVQQDIITSRAQKQLSVQIFPFVREDGIVKKLTGYELKQTKSAQSRKATAATIHSYAANSVLASGNFVKIRISQTGIYRLTYSELQAMGISSPANVRIFGYGGAMLNQAFSVAKTDDLPEVAIYDGGDYILFYAQGPVKWTYSSSLKRFTHQNNIYSDYGYYFITSDAGTGKRITTTSTELSADGTLPINTFVDYGLHEQDIINLVDKEKGTAGGGKEFYGETFGNTQSYTFNFSFPNIVETSTYNRASIDLAVAATTSSSFTILTNGGQTRSAIGSILTTSDSYIIAKALSTSYVYTSTTSSPTITLTYNQAGNTSNKAYLNYIEMNAERKLQMSGNAMFFRNPSYTGLSVNSLYKISGASANVQVWNITDPSNIYAMPTTLVGDTLQFVATNSTLQEFVACNLSNAGSLPAPTVIGSVANQNLHALTDIDFVIITHPDFKSQAETLAQAHRDIDNMNVAVVTTDEVYNEFSSGTPDATAYRWIMKMLYDRSNSNSSLRMPSYLLLFGDGTFDNRKKLSTSGENKILTYQATNSLSEVYSYVTDDYFGFLDDSEGDVDVSGRMDIGVGRFCVTTSEQASNVVNKTITYMNNQSKGIWKNQVCFLGDDGNSGTHMRDANTVATSVSDKNRAYQINKIFLDAYLQEVSAAGQTYPLAKNKFDNLLRNGMLMLNYSGHGGATEITNESMLKAKDIRALSNENMALWSFATCSFSKFDATTLSGGEESVLNPVGGSIGILSAARTVFAAQNLTLVKHFNDSLFAHQDGPNNRIGDAVRRAKNATASDINKMPFVYIGDPAVRLNFPNKYNVVTETVNGVPATQADTLRALSTAIIAGAVTDQSGNVMTSFNGTVQITVYDKISTITTLNNDGDSGELTFTDWQNTIFSGKANVENGRFTISFMIPKDIKYNYGTGRINYYVSESTTGEEGMGYFENFYVGGSNTDFEEEEVGPEMAIYLNSTAFVSGGQVNETPQFLAYIQDENGVNTSGVGIGHDLMLLIDDDPEQYYILNEYFETNEGDFRSGSVKYQLAELEEGKHTLTFRAWDLLNNSTTQTLNFEVVKGLDVTIYSVNSYPNPARQNEQISIKISHDRPNTILETQVYIYDISGRLVYNQTYTSADNIVWNLSDANVLPGIYLYKINIKTEDSEFTSKTNKIIVLGQ